jgi:hypothetical protein
MSVSPQSSGRSGNPQIFKPPQLSFDLGSANNSTLSSIPPPLQVPLTTSSLDSFNFQANPLGTLSPPVGSANFSLNPLTRSNSTTLPSGGDESGIIAQIIQVLTVLIQLTTSKQTGANPLTPSPVPKPGEAPQDTPKEPSTSMRDQFNAAFGGKGKEGLYNFITKMKDVSNATTHDLTSEDLDKAINSGKLTAKQKEIAENIKKHYSDVDAQIKTDDLIGGDDLEMYFPN